MFQLLTVVVFVLIAVEVPIAAQLTKPCVLNGVTYRYGETTVEMQDNGMLYRCTCKLLSNQRLQRRCNSSAEDAHLVLSDVIEIKKFALGDGRAFVKPFIKNLPGTTVAVDVDVISDYVYWSDVSFNRTGIYRAQFTDGSRIIKIISEEISEPNGISVDWLTHHIYWTDAQLGAIYMSQNDGRNRIRLIGGLQAPRGIVVLPTIGLMFWTDNTRGTVERAKMDGTDHRVIVNNLISPNEIAVSLLNRHIFWIDGEAKKIERCDFDGTFSSYKKIYDFNELDSPAAYGLSLFNNRLYFALWDKGKIYSIKLDGSDWRIATTGVGSRPMGMTIVNHKLQTYVRLSNPCWGQQSPCSHICLPRSHVDYRCACPSNTGLVLGSDRRTCTIPQKFLLTTSIEEGTVMMISMDKYSDQYPVVLTQADQPVAVDFDPVSKMVYYSDVGMYGIYRKSLSSQKPQLFTNDGIEIVDGMAIDPINRHLYFTNVGWKGNRGWFHHLELIELNNPTKRRVLTTDGLDKPRAISLDIQAGFLYLSDWGEDPKIIRLDLDGKNAQKLPLTVENPNGVVHDGKNIYFTDSHYKSSEDVGNGTRISTKFARIARYNSRLEDFYEIDSIETETPFGITFGDGNLFFTDWGLNGIYQVSTDGQSSKALAVGIRKPTGIKFAKMDPSDDENGLTNICHREETCSDICIPITDDDVTCLCSNSGMVLSENHHRCVEPDEFVLVADRIRILLKSLRPNDPDYYVIVGGYDVLSNILAVVYDPINKLIYWADSGRKRIGRKFLNYDVSGGSGDDDVIYSDIDLVEGMAIDPQQQLLYWTDTYRGTIEVLDVSTAAFKHATILTQLQSPRGITLNPQSGLMYWTEVGLHPGIFQAAMNGQNTRQIVKGGITIPNGIFYNSTSNLLWVADANNLNVQSYAPQGDGYVLDYSDFYGIASDIYGMVEIGNNYLLTDRVQHSLIFVKDYEAQVLISDMYNPAQIHLQQIFHFPGPSTVCFMDTCSHICVPDGSDWYACVCPQHLVLDQDLRTCITEEKAKRLEEEILKTEITEVIINKTTFPWANIPATTTFKIEATTTAEPTTIASTTENKTIAIMTSQPTTTEETTTISTTTKKPPGPYFTRCGGETPFEFVLPDDKATVDITAELMNIYALDGNNNRLDVFVKGWETTTIQLGAAKMFKELQLYAFDAWGRKIECSVRVQVSDKTAPWVMTCPNDINVDSFLDDEIAYVTWKPPTFGDNSVGGNSGGGNDVDMTIISSNSPGYFSRGIHNITYTAIDIGQNRATCSFLVSITKMDNICGKPYQPPFSQLMCTSTNKKEIKQICNITCSDSRYLTLADPHVRCSNPQDIWHPNLNENVCQEASTGNVRQQVHVEYTCPCVDSAKFYETRLETLALEVKQKAACEDRKAKLGLCKDTKNKLQLNCHDENTLEVVITVDLASASDVRTTDEARSIVRRSASEMMIMFTTGQIQAQGSDKEMYSANSFSKFTDYEVVCPEGHINKTDGCIPCPPGTYLSMNKCIFCPLHHYQGRPAQTYCQECAKNKGTELRGAQHISNCKPMEREVASSLSDSNLLLYIAIGGGVVLLIAASCIIFFFVRRKKNNKIKKQKREELKRKRQQALELREMRRNRNHRRSKRTPQQLDELRHEQLRNEQLRHEDLRRSFKAAQQHRVQHPEMTNPETPGTTSDKPETRTSSNEEGKSPPPSYEGNPRSQNDDVVNDDDVSNKSSSVATGNDDEKNDVIGGGGGSGDAESAIFTADEVGTGSETTGSVVSSQLPSEVEKPKRKLKSALKKGASPPTHTTSSSVAGMNRILSDDETTVISATSLNRAQLQQLQKRQQRSSSLDRHDKVRGGRYDNDNDVIMTSDRGRRRQKDDVIKANVSRTSSIRSILKKDRKPRHFPSFNEGQLRNRMPPPGMPPSHMYPPAHHMYLGPGRMRLAHGPRHVLDNMYGSDNMTLPRHPRYMGPPHYWDGPQARFMSMPRMRLPPRYPPPPRHRGSPHDPILPPPRHYMPRHPPYY